MLTTEQLELLNYSCTQCYKRGCHAVEHAVEQIAIKAGEEVLKRTRDDLYACATLLKNLIEMIETHYKLTSGFHTTMPDFDSVDMVERAKSFLARMSCPPVAGGPLIRNITND